METASFSNSGISQDVLTQAQCSFEKLQTDVDFDVMKPFAVPRSAVKPSEIPAHLYQQGNKQRRYAPNSR